MKLRLGDRVRHRRRDQYGIYQGLTAHPEEAWVLFDGEQEAVKVSRDQLAKVAEHAEPRTAAGHPAHTPGDNQ